MSGGRGCEDAATRVTVAGVRVPESGVALLVLVVGAEGRLRTLDTAPSVTNWLLCSTKTGQYCQLKE